MSKHGKRCINQFLTKISLSFELFFVENPSCWKIITLENGANNNNNFGFQTLAIFSKLSKSLVNYRVLVISSTINIKVATLSIIWSTSLGFCKFLSFDHGGTYITTVYYVSFITTFVGVIELQNRISMFRLRNRRRNLLSREESINKTIVSFIYYHVQLYHFVC